MALWSRNTYYSDYCNKPSAVYRIFDAEGSLLYIGMALRPENRVMAHKRKPWGHLIDHYTVEWFDNRWEALAAEKLAIHHENPIHNIVRPRVECN